MPTAKARFAAALAGLDLYAHPGGGKPHHHLIVLTSSPAHSHVVQHRQTVPGGQHENAHHPQSPETAAPSSSALSVLALGGFGAALATSPPRPPLHRYR